MKQLFWVTWVLVLGACGGTTDTCTNGRKPCSGSCIDVTSDSTNCGLCGVICAAGSGCVAGACKVDPKFGCAADQLLCDQVCTDSQTDAMNCGMCRNICPTSYTCMAGVCADPCAPGTTCTADGASSCVDLTSSNTNCGSCGNVCASAQTCSASVCTCPTATPMACGTLASLACIDPQSDANNCGSCGNACGPSKVCSSGSCICSCQGGATQCGSGSSCYCADLETDSMNCHACGSACSSGAICTGGGCVCLAGRHVCGVVCVDFTNDNMNCGGCNVTCDTSSGQTCVKGTCQCPGAEPMTCSNRCVDLAVDATHCGDCATVCPGSSTCFGGHCTCDGSTTKVSCGNSCVDLNGDGSNCGACANACTVGQSCFDRGCLPTSTQGTLGLLAGNVSAAGNADGAGGAASFRNPLGIATDLSGNVFVADSSNQIIRQIVIATQQVTTLAGTAGVTGNIDSTGTAASFRIPIGIAADNAGNVYVAELGNRTIRKIVVATGNVTTIAGTALTAGTANGTGAAASFTTPRALAVDGSGNLWVADQGAGSIRKIVLSSSAVSTLATGLNAPEGIAADGAGNLFVALEGDSTIDKIVISSGAVSLVAGTTGVTGSANGTGSAASFNHPGSIALDGSGNLFVADETNALIRKVIVASGVVSTVVGSTTSTLTLGPLPGSITASGSVAVTPSGGLVIAEGLVAGSGGNCVLIAYP